MKRICEHCCQEFTTDSTRAKYCPPPRKCRTEASVDHWSRRCMCRRFTDAALLASVPTVLSLAIAGAAVAMVEEQTLLEHQPRHGASGRN